MQTNIHDVFVTDTDYDVDEETLASVFTVEPGLIVRAPSSVVDKLKVGHMVRFVSSINATDYLTVRAISAPDASSEVEITIDNSVDLPVHQDFKIHLIRQWVPKTLPLKSRFQHITQVEILAYTIVGLTSASGWEEHQDHVPPNLEYVGFEIKELPGFAKSTNPYMENMLAVIPTRMPAYHPYSWLEARDSMIFVPDGMFRTVYNSPLLAVNTLTPRLLDRKGDLVRAARFHVWLRVTVLEK